MKLSSTAENIITQISDKKTKLGDLRKIANVIKKDHELAMELWSTTHYLARQLAILLMDKKLLSKEIIDRLVSDIEQHQQDEKLQLIDWLMANQLAKDKRTIVLMESWEKKYISPSKTYFLVPSSPIAMGGTNAATQ